jgi:sporulation protein YlmC with PRC-barrel domain
MKRLRVLSAALSLVTAIVWSASLAGAQDRQSKGASKAAQQQGRMWHFIVSAWDLIGSPVYDSKGERAGEIEYLMIGTDNGEVRYVVVSSGGFLDIGDELRAVPWSAFDAPVSRTAARLDVTKKQLQESYKTDEESLVDLTKPTVIAQVTEYWAPLVDEQGGDKKTGSKSKAAGSKEQKQQEQKGGDRAEAKAKSSTGSAAKSDSKTQTAKKDEAGVPHILVGQGLITTVVAPAVQSAKELVGAEVRSADGKEVGEIDHLMIETSGGRVAYVLISRGGFLGLGGEWVPVPFELLSQSPSSEALTLKVKASELQKIKALPKTEQPRSVRQSDLAKLYQQYNVEPFWSKNEQKDNQKKK